MNNVGKSNLLMIIIPSAAGFLLFVTLVILFFATDVFRSDVNGDDAESDDVTIAEPTPTPTPAPQPTPSPTPEPTPEPQEDEEPTGEELSPRVTHLSRWLTSREMRSFEADHAVSAAQERYLAFGAYVMTNNRESIRVFALHESESRHSAGALLSNFWSIEDRASALVQLESLSAAEGQSPVADDIYHTLVVNNFMEYVDGFELFLAEYYPLGLENVFDAAVRRAERLEDEFEALMEFADAGEEDREDMFELFVYLQFADRINSGLEAYWHARGLLIDNFGYTEEELLNLPTLAAWDYGRVAIIARYGAEAGYITEDVAWEHLKKAADSAADVYDGWRDYTAAHILGRALAFGSSSEDFLNSLDFLLLHPESSFQTIDFHR